MNSIYLLFGFVIGLLNAAVLLIIYSRYEQIITRSIDRTIENKEKAQFFEPISEQEKLDEIFNIKNNE